MKSEFFARNKNFINILTDLFLIKYMIIYILFDLSFAIFQIIEIWFNVYFFDKKKNDSISLSVEKFNQFWHCNNIKASSLYIHIADHFIKKYNENVPFWFSVLKQTIDVHFPFPKQVWTIRYQIFFNEKSRMKNFIPARQKFRIVTYRTNWNWKAKAS